MSVLKSKRNESKMEYVNVAYKIYSGTINFLAKLSARYSRLIAEPIAEIASNLLTNVSSANNVYPGDIIQCQERERFLLRAKGALASLDTHLALCYEVLMKNPEGAFKGSGDDPLPPDKAKTKLDKMAQNLGEMIDAEERMLKKVLNQTRDNLRTAKENELKKQMQAGMTQPKELDLDGLHEDDDFPF